MSVSAKEENINSTACGTNYSFMHPLWFLYLFHPDKKGYYVGLT